MKLIFKMELGKMMFSEINVMERLLSRELVRLAFVMQPFAHFSQL